MNHMKLSAKALGAACALLWGGAIFIGGVCHGIWPSYAGAFLEFAASIYPGYHPGGGAINLLAGTIYGVADAGIGDALLAWLYNRMA